MAEMNRQCRHRGVAGRRSRWVAVAAVGLGVGWLASGAPGEAGMTQSLSQHGITWHFDEPVPYGQYANGDYWVLGPVNVVGIDPASQTLSDRTIHGSMINPSPRDGSTTGYGQTRDTGYDASRNVAKDVSASQPLAIGADSSLVSTISTAEANARPGIDTAAVLTVVGEAPAANAFRPPYSGSDKNSPWTTDDLRYDLLPRLEPVEQTPDIAAMAAHFQRVWLDHVPGWTGRAIHPITSMPAYGRDMASRLGQGSLMLMLDFPDEQKRDLLVNFVQVGIDFYGIVEDGGENNWVPNGGHAQGRKWPILFAGTMLDDEAMAGIGQREDVYFGEDGQTFYVTETEVERTDLHVMDPNHSNYVQEYADGYTEAMLGMPEWGIRHATDPRRDSPDPGRAYRMCCTAASWHGHVLSALLMDLKDAWNHDAIFDYSERYLGRLHEEGWPELNPQGAHEHTDTGFTKQMWDTYRDQVLELLAGDMNLDGVVDSGDVAPFVLALTDPAEYMAQFGVDEATMIALGDINRDGALDTGDVAAFVQLLVGGPTSVPEPGTLAMLGVATVVLMRRGGSARRWR